jgi:hypothetical protein
MRWWRSDGLSFGVAVAIGLAISTGYPAGFVAAIAMPVACLIPESRKAAFRNAVGYYSAGLWPMIPGAQRYLGQSSSLLVATLIWLCSAILLSLPWTLAWTRNSRLHHLWRVPLANLAAVVPPLALIGLISPMSGAGYLFPGAGWIGLAAATLLPGIVLSLSRRNAAVHRTLLHVAVTALIALGVGSHVSTPSRVELPAGWEAVNTKFGDLSQPYQEFAAMQSIQRHVAASSARVLVFPESVVPRWSDATDEFWRQTLDGCRARGQVLAIGAGLPLSVPALANGNVDASVVKSYDFAPAMAALQMADRQATPIVSTNAAGGALIKARHDSFENTLLILGVESATFYQRIPVPIGMWHPFGNEGVPLHLNGQGAIQIARERVAVLICYEQILVYPVFASMLQRPSILVGISNTLWVSDTPIPRYQANAVRSWAKLFRVPYLTATNS